MNKGATSTEAKNARCEADVFGKLLKEFAEGNEAATAVLEFDTGDEYEVTAATYFESAESWSTLDRWLMGYAFGAVLDIGTGAGRYSLDLRGRSGVTALLGVDDSPAAVDVATMRGLRAVVGAFPLSMPPEVRRADRWNTLLLMGNNLGLLSQPDGDPDPLRGLLDLAVPGGVLLGTSGQPSVLPPAVQHASLERWGRPGAFRSRFILGDIVSAWSSYEFHDPAQLQGRATEAGWIVEGARHIRHQWGLCLRAPTQ